MALSKKKVKQVQSAKKTKRQLKEFTEEQKAEAVRRVREDGEKKTHVARSIGVRESTLRGWVKMLENEGRLPGSSKRSGQEKKDWEVIMKKPASFAPTAEKKAPKVIEREIVSSATSAATEDKARIVIERKAASLATHVDEKAPKVYVAPLTPPPTPKREAVCGKSKGRPRTIRCSTNAQRKRIGEVSFAKSATKRKHEEVEPQPKRSRPNGPRCSARNKFKEERQRRDAMNLYAPEFIEKPEFFHSLGLMRRPTPPPETLQRDTGFEWLTPPTSPECERKLNGF